MFPLNAGKSLISAAETLHECSKNSGRNSSVMSYPMISRRTIVFRITGRSLQSNSIRLASDASGRFFLSRSVIEYRMESRGYLSGFHQSCDRLTQPAARKMGSRQSQPVLKDEYTQFHNYRATIFFDDIYRKDEVTLSIFPRKCVLTMV